MQLTTASQYEQGGEGRENFAPKQTIVMIESLSFTQRCP